MEFRLVGPNWCPGRRSPIKTDFEEFTLSFRPWAAHLSFCRQSAVRNMFAQSRSLSVIARNSFLRRISDITLRSHGGDHVNDATAMA